MKNYHVTNRQTVQNRDGKELILQVNIHEFSVALKIREMLPSRSEIMLKLNGSYQKRDKIFKQSTYKIRHFNIL